MWNAQGLAQNNLLFTSQMCDSGMSYSLKWIFYGTEVPGCAPRPKGSGWGNDSMVECCPFLE